MEETIEQQIARLQAENEALKASEAKTRKMSPKGFLHKSNTKAANSAAAFLAQYREWLTTGELATVTSPILRKLDDKELLPTPALKLIQAAVMGHIIASDQKRTEEAIENASQPGTQKPWLAQVFDAKGNICTRTKDDGEVEDLVKGFNTSSEADRWTDRRLFDGASDWYGVVTHTSLNLKSIIHRQDAIARILRQPKGPATHSRGMSTKTLGFGVKAKQDRASFSRG